MNNIKPVAVVISDVHYSLSTLELADKAFRMAIDEAARLVVPLIDCGDLTNDKAILRGEVVNTIITTMKYAEEKGVTVYNLVGNHSLLNEKGEENALHFLQPYTTLIQHPVSIDGLNFIPYQNSAEKVEAALAEFLKGSLIFMHQGVQGAWMGDYVQDKTSLPKEAFADYRIISGHYHRAQDIKTGRPRNGGVGLFSYVGNPYTLSFGEHNDGPKGFQILHSDGLLTQVPTNLRKHVVVEFDEDALTGVSSITRGPRDLAWGIRSNDLVWAKLHGPASILDKVNKKDLGKSLGVENFRMDKIETEVTRLEDKTEKLTELQVLDKLIDQTGEPDNQKSSLKNLARELLNAA